MELLLRKELKHDSLKRRVFKLKGVPLRPFCHEQLRDHVAPIQLGMLLLAHQVMK